MFCTVNFEKDLIIRNRADFIVLHENKEFLILNKKTKEEEPTSFIKAWLKDSTIRTYEKLDFLPMQQTPHNIYNSFDCYNVIKKNMINDGTLNFEDSLIFKHLKNLCNNDDKCIDYVLKFIARKIKHPYKNTNTALIFKSKPGAGKNIFWDWVRLDIIGSDYSLETDKPEHLFGRFTSLLQNKIFIVINETSGKDTFNLNENIKAAITAKENIIEIKGMSPFKNTNNTGYTFLTNNENPIKVAYDDRRFCGIECNNSIFNNSKSPVIVMDVNHDDIVC